MTGRIEELEEFRSMVGRRSFGFWHPTTWDDASDEEGHLPRWVPGRDASATARGKIRERIELSDLLWPKGDARRARARRFKRLLRTVFAAASYAMVGAADVLNAHIRANGRMLFEFNRNSFPLLIRFFFHGTRDGIDLMFQGVPEEMYAFTASRARLPSWVRTTTIETAFATRLFNKIVEASFSHAAFEFIVKRRLEGLGWHGRPTCEDILCEALQQQLEEEGDEREEPPPPWSLTPDAELAPVLDELFDLFKQIDSSLISKMVSTNAASLLENPGVPQYVDESLALAQSLRERAEMLGGDARAIRLAATASSRAHKLWSFDRNHRNSVPLPVPHPRFEAPDLVLDCATMRDLLLSLGVPVPSLDDCKIDVTGLFSQVFRIEEHAAKLSARDRRRYRFRGVIRTTNEIAYVHFAAKSRGATRKKRPRPGKTIACDPSKDVYP